MDTKLETPLDGPAVAGTDRGGPAAQLVVRYLTAFYSGDFEGAEPLVAGDFSFRGPFLEVDGRAAFFEGAEGLRRIVRGHRLLRQWENGAEVCAIYEVDIETPLGAGAVLMSEWDTVHGGQIIASRVIFDSALFRALVPHR